MKIIQSLNKSNIISKLIVQTNIIKQYLPLHFEDFITSKNGKKIVYHQNNYCPSQSIIFSHASANFLFLALFQFIFTWCKNHNSFQMCCMPIYTFESKKKLRMQSNRRERKVFLMFTSFMGSKVIKIFSTHLSFLLTLFNIPIYKRKNKCLFVHNFVTSR